MFDSFSVLVDDFNLKVLARVTIRLRDDGNTHPMCFWQRQRDGELRLVNALHPAIAAVSAVTPPSQLTLVPLVALNRWEAVDKNVPVALAVNR